MQERVGRGSALVRPSVFDLNSGDVGQAFDWQKVIDNAQLALFNSRFQCRQKLSRHGTVNHPMVAGECCRQNIG